MTTQTLGLVLFASVVALNVAGLAIDAALAEHGIGTVSDFARRNQWLAALIIIVNIVGVLGLAMHFSNGKE